MRQLLEDLRGCPCVMVVFFSSARSRSRKACSCRKRGGVLLPGGIVVEREHAAVQARLGDRARDDGRRRRCARGRRCCRWPTMPAAPPIVQCAPMRALPAMPTQPAIAVCAPMRTLWPIWIRLSSLTPSSITVSSSAPRSMQVLAPISTSSPMRTRAELLDLLPAAVGRARSRSRRRRSPTPLCTMQRAPIGSRRPSVTRGAEARAAPIAAAAADEAVRRRSTAPSPIAAPASTTANAPIDDVGADAARRVDHRAGVDAGRRRAAASRSAHHWVSRAK